MAESSNTVANTSGTSTTNPPLDVNPAILERFSGLDTIVFGCGFSINEWDDEKMVGNAKIELNHCNTGDNTARSLAETALKALYGSFSEQTLGIIMFMAWQLRAPSWGFVFPATDETAAGTNDITYANLSQTIIHNATAIVEPQFRGSNRQVVQAAAYISASLLRLFVKPPATYINAWDRIVAGYSRSYRAPFPVTNLRPMEDNLNTIHLQFTRRAIFKHTLQSFLYCFEDLGGNQQIVRVLFEQYLAFSGMHAYPLFTSACAGLRVKSGELLAVLDFVMTRSALPVIHKIRNYHELPKSEELRLKRKRKTWRYATLFHRNVFADLQTRNCRELVLILAYINEALGTRGSGSLLDIHQIRTMSDCEKERYERVAYNIIEWARTSRNDPNDKQTQRFLKILSI